MCAKSTSSIFHGLVIQKSARRANLRQQEIEMACLIIKYCSMYIKVPNHLHCFFVVMNANESVLILSSKLNPLFCDDEWYKLVPWGVMHNRWYVHNFCQNSRDLAFPDKILQGVREEKLQLRDLRIFLKQTITWTGDFLMFFITYFILSESNSLVKIISISMDNDFSP